MSEYVARVYERFAVDLPVRAFVNSIVPRFELDGQVKELGGGGLRAEFLAEICEGTRVILELMYGWGSVRFEGRVRWKHPRNGTVVHGFVFDVPLGNASARMMAEEARKARRGT